MAEWLVVVLILIAVGGVSGFLAWAAEREVYGPGGRRGYERRRQAAMLRHGLAMIEASKRRADR